ncbi:MAG: hypothetical protein WB679_23775 [Terracidiphilus sp.]
MKNLWRILFTGGLCLLVLGGISVLGFVMWKEIPLLSAAAVVADGGIVFGFYKVVLDTVDAANKLENVGLENQKLRLEIEEKKAAAEKVGAHVVPATWGDIEKYASLRPNQSARYKGARLASGGAAFLTLFVAAVVFYSSLKSSDGGGEVGETSRAPQTTIEGKAAEIVKTEESLYPKTVCGKGTLDINPSGFISFWSDSALKVNLTFVLSDKGATLIFPLKPDDLASELASGREQFFAGANPDIQIPTSGSIQIKDDKNKIVTTCHFESVQRQRVLEEAREAEVTHAREAESARTERYAAEPHADRPVEHTEHPEP